MGSITDLHHDDLDLVVSRPLDDIITASYFCDIGKSNFLTMGITTVPLVKVKGKYQVTLPASIRQKVGVLVGDLLEAKVEKDKITLTPKRVVDREVAMALDDMRKGRVHGPFRSVDKLLRSLHTARKKRKKIS